MQAPLDQLHNAAVDCSSRPPHHNRAITHDMLVYAPHHRHYFETRFTTPGHSHSHAAVAARLRSILQAH